MRTGEQRGQDADRGWGGYLSPICSLTPPSPALSVVPLLLAAAAAASPPSSPSPVFTLFDWGCSCSTPFCLLVGRHAEAEAWAARRWRGFATAGGKEEKNYNYVGRDEHTFKVIAMFMKWSLTCFMVLWHHNALTLLTLLCCFTTLPFLCC